MKRFSNKTILVTGGASGMGAATVLRIVSEDGTAIIADLNSEKAAQLAESLKGQPGAVHFVTVDLSDFDSIQEMAAKVAQLTPALHGVVNSAGIPSGEKDLASPDPAIWRRALAINLEASAYVVGLLLPLLKAGKASIVNISSDGGLKARAGIPIYDATKAALISLSKSMAAALAKDGIRVNALAPGWTVTEFHYSHATDPAARKRELETMDTDYCLMRRHARPQEIAAAITFLLSDDASYITGTTLCVDGGRVGF